MKKIKLYDFEGDGKTVEVSLEAILSKARVVYNLGRTSHSPGKVRKSNKGLVKKGEKKCEK